MSRELEPAVTVMTGANIFASSQRVTTHCTCTLCGQSVRKHALAMASHGKKHVRAGEAVSKTVWGWDKMPRTIYVVILPDLASPTPTRS